MLTQHYCTAACLITPVGRSCSIWFITQVRWGEFWTQQRPPPIFTRKEKVRISQWWLWGQLWSCGAVCASSPAQSRHCSTQVSHWRHCSCFSRFRRIVTYLCMTCTQYMSITKSPAIKAVFFFDCMSVIWTEGLQLHLLQAALVILLHSEDTDAQCSSGCFLADCGWRIDITQF